MAKISSGVLRTRPIHPDGGQRLNRAATRDRATTRNRFWIDEEWFDTAIAALNEELPKVSRVRPIQSWTSRLKSASRASTYGPPLQLERMELWPAVSSPLAAINVARGAACKDVRACLEEDDHVTYRRMVDELIDGLAGESRAAMTAALERSEDQ